MARTKADTTRYVSGSGLGATASFSILMPPTLSETVGDGYIVALASALNLSNILAESEPFEIRARGCQSFRLSPSSKFLRVFLAISNIPQRD